MQLSFSTNAFTEHSVLEALTSIAAIGYSGVEILADQPHLFADSFAEQDLVQIRKVLEAKGLIAANINANTATGYYGATFWEPLFEPSLANPEEQARRWRIAYTRKCIDIAVFLGSTAVSITSGRMVPGVSPDESARLLRQSLEEILPYAQEKQVRVGMEYEPGLLVESSAELAGLIKDMGSEYFGANLDLGHSHVLGEILPEVWSQLGESVFHVHLEDIKDQKHYHLIPGMGDMEIEQLLHYLNDNSYAGFVSVELYTYKHMPEFAARRSFEYLMNFSVWS